jgi:hypothetical protein
MPCNGPRNGNWSDAALMEMIWMHDFRMGRALVFPGSAHNQSCQGDSMVDVTEMVRHS